MEKITIVVKHCCIEVVDGQVKGSELKFWDTDFEIYVKGHVTIKRRDSVNYHAFEQARARHIPLINLKAAGWV